MRRLSRWKARSFSQAPAQRYMTDRCERREPGRGDARTRFSLSSVAATSQDVWSDVQLSAAEYERTSAALSEASAGMLLDVHRPELGPGTKLDQYGWSSTSKQRT